MYCITPHKCKSLLAKYSDCNIEFSHTTTVIPITSPYNMVTIRIWRTGEAHVGRGQLKPLALFKIRLLVI